MNNYSNNTRSMNGLNNINANSLNSNEIDVDILVVNTSGTCPTRPNGDNTLNLANTAFVSNAVSGLTISNYVTLNTVQTITAEKTFIDNVNMTNGLLGNYINASSSLDTPAIGSGLGSDNLSVGYNQITGVLNLGCRSNRTANINIGTLATGNAPIIIGSTASTTQTATHNAITTFNKIPNCSVVPTSGDNLCNKTYVDSMSGAGLLNSNNTWTGTNNFKDVVYINNPSATKTMILKSTNQNITYTLGASNSGGSGVSFNCNTITVPSDNTENLLIVQFPFNIAGYGGGLNYPAGTVTLTYTSFSINILKNGASYSGSSPSATLYNYDTFIREWNLPSTSVKYPVFSALLGNIRIPVSLDLGNTSTDTYTINFTVNGTAVHSSGGIFTLGFSALTTGNSIFTVGDYNNTSAVFLNTNPSYIAYSKLSGDDGIYISTNNKLNIESTSSINFLTSTNFNSVLPQSTLTPLNNNDLATKIYIDNAITQAINFLTPYTNPVGSIIMMPTATVPTGYLYCDGSTYNTILYASLWSVILYTYGGSGSSFRVPDMRSIFIRGFGSQTIGGVTYTAPALGVVQQDAVLTPLYASNEGFRSCGAGTRDCVARSIITTDPTDTNTGILPRFDREATENRPVNMSVYYYIKY
jgi:hypothetical protein